MRINNNNKFFKLSFLFVGLLFFASLKASAQDTALIGEDLYDPRGTGVVLTVNEYSKRSFGSGLRSNVKRDEVFINLTLVNTGTKSYEVNPAEDFFLQFDKAYKPETTENRALLNSFQLFPTMQTRLDLYFIVDSDSTKSIPRFFFKFNGSLLKILCDNDAGKSLQGNNLDMSVETSLSTAKSLIEASKLEEARKILLAARNKEPENPFVLMLLASVEEKDGEPEMAATYMRAINPERITKTEDAVEVAKMALRLDYSQIAVNLLEGLDERGMLNSQQKLVLAKAYYAQDRFSKAEYVLLPIISTGHADKDSHFIMGNIFNRKGDLNRAITQWEMALDVDPNYAEALYNIGVAYFKQQRVDKAQDYWRKVLSVQPDAETLRAAEEALKATQY